MEHVTVTLDTDTGRIRMLYSPVSAPLITPGAIIRRASHVEPDTAILRVIFHALRAIFGDYGRIAELTRSWPCLWRVNLAPIGRGVLPERYVNRIEAIQAEVTYLETNWL